MYIGRLQRRQRWRIVGVLLSELDVAYEPRHDELVVCPVGKCGVLLCSLYSAAQLELGLALALGLNLHQ